ncbi:MAG: methyltransferase [Bacteroidales bacterium]|nr:methyltransferase [Bacteroidales bacterium]
MFRFKQFSIEDRGATMKVGTDAVLLGALSSPDNEPKRILDIGTGCGVIALMMAQRFPSATIHAIDIDNPSTIVASDNFRLSPWHTRIHCQNISLQKYVLLANDSFNLIISNPPYYSNSLKNSDPQKRKARHDDSLTPVELFECSFLLLKQQGELWIIIPTIEKEKFLNAAQNRGLRNNNIIDICTSCGKSPRLSILSFKREPNQTVMLLSDAPDHTSVAIRDENNNYTSWYQHVMEPFLLQTHKV